MKKTPLRRMQDKTRFEENGCWTVTKGLNKDGYARIRADEKQLLAHRWSYEYFGSQIPAGFVVDHLCKNRACWNPEHLEAVTQHENLMRVSENLMQNRCKHGHEFTPENTYTNPKTGYRDCRICQAERKRNWAAINRA